MKQSNNASEMCLSRSQHVSDYFSADEIQQKSSTSILLFRAQSDIKKDQLTEQIKTENPDIAGDENKINALVAPNLTEFREKYIAETSGGMLEDLPADVSEALMELGGMDIYSLVIGTIFYRLAGLLLPIIFVIMCSNNIFA